ncbi:MAG: hypothetical protein HUJ25_11625 [Crocinitomicaceae bacterium]|nr:hypothetical protein [Crocinitomicaceae bacterium]
MKKLILNYLVFVLPVFFLIACSGSEESSSSDSDKEVQEEDPCEEMEVEDFRGFLGIYQNTHEAHFKDIFPGEATGSYNDDKSAFTYVFDDVEDVSTYITVNAESGDVEYYNILLNSYTEKDLTATQKRMRKNYDIDECHDQFFMMSQKEIEKIMGTDNTVDEIETGDYWLQYWDDDTGMEVHFYFPTINDLGCIMIRVIYS